MNHLSRRKFLTTLGAATSTALLSNCSSNSANNTAPKTNFPSISKTPEISTVRLGYIPSLEIAPLLVAQAQKLFAKHEMNVQLVPFQTWQGICDRTEIGTNLGTSLEGIDGGHFYSPLPELLTEGLMSRNKRRTPMYVIMRLHTNGGYIVASRRLRPFGIRLQRESFVPLQRVARLFGDAINGAIVKARSNHELWLRYWLASLQMVPQQDIKLLEIPSNELANNVKQNKVDLLSLDRWNTIKLNNINLADPAIAIQEIWQNYPGEIFALRADWVDKYPIATQSIVKAIMEAQIWCDNPDNAKALNTLLALNLTNSSSLINQPVQAFSEIFRNSPNQKLDSKTDSQIDRQGRFPIKYWLSDGISVSYPYKSHDLWFLTEYQRWKMLSNQFETREVIDAVNREDLWKSAARELGIPDTNIPASNSRGTEVFFDGVSFDSQNPEKYLSTVNP
ncbi:MAG: hypothetical protein DCE90_18745 [Pseudanabaena sp.]|nr:MAG: hypothetical protein DCE90_18745 [Pseudanabaena sp.]